MTKQLFRNKQKSSVGGVCAGLADYFEVDVTLIRAIFLVALLGFGSGFLLYIILWIVVPEQNVYAQNFQQADYTINEDKSAPIPVGMPVKEKRNDSVIAGLVLVTLGVIFMADEFIPWFEIDKLWPLILVAIGAGIIWNHSQKNKSSN